MNSEDIINEFKLAARTMDCEPQKYIDLNQAINIIKAHNATPVTLETVCYTKPDSQGGLLAEDIERLNIIKDFNNDELMNILRKTKKVKIKDNIKGIMCAHFGEDEYIDGHADEFFNKYKSKVTRVYEWCDDWWICEEDSHVITNDCFEKVSK